MAKAPSRFLALLRGINVGGNNIIAKDDLRACFEELGHTSVRTYIQSGNILFRSSTSSVRTLTSEIQSGLSARFKYDAQAVVLTHAKYKSIVASAPKEWGCDDAQRHNAMFTLPGITSKQVLRRIPQPKPEYETVVARPGIVFWSVSKQHQTKSTLMKLPQNSVYKQLTVRNHNTVNKLLHLFDEI